MTNAQIASTGANPSGAVLEDTDKAVAIAQRFANISGRGAAVFLRSAFDKLAVAQAEGRQNVPEPRAFKGTGFEGMGVFGAMALLSHDKLAHDAAFHQRLTQEAGRMQPAQAARFAGFCALNFAMMNGAPGIAQASRQTRLDGIAPVLGGIWLRGMTALPAPEAYQQLTQPGQAIWTMADHPAVSQQIGKLVKKLELHLPAKDQPHLAQIKRSLALG